MSIKYITGSKLPTKFGTFNIHCFEEQSTGKEHICLSMGDIKNQQPVLTRIHSECITGDSFFSLRCDCGEQLQIAMESIAKNKSGLLVYLRQEGRGIGLSNKIKAYKLQDTGLDTVQANEELGFEPDQRCYDSCLEILSYFDIKKIKLMTNNPAKLNALTRLGIEVIDRIPIQTERNPHNENYLETKACKLGHFYKY